MAKSDKTEKPTPKRRREAQEKGQSARSRDLTQAFVFLNAVVVLGFMGAVLFGQMQLVISSTWRELLLEEISLNNIEQIIRHGVFSVMKLAAPLVLLTLLIGFSATGLQSGFRFSSHNLKPKLKGLSPASNLKRIFSKRGLMQLLKASLLIGIISYLGYSAITGSMGDFLGLALMDVKSGIRLFGDFIFSLCLKISLLLTVIGVIDYIFQKYKFEEDLKQSKQEVKEDMKATEGDPLVKGRIRRLQREMARKRMMAAVPEADVVITNPTHFAVALKYEVENMEAPMVVAKGRGFLAQRIKELAAQHGVPTVENKPLAQALFKTAEVGEQVPGDLYRAVAQVLAYVYRLRQESWN